MRGYPKYVTTKRDYVNLLAYPEFKAQAAVELQGIHDLNDDFVQKATTPIDPDDPEKGWNTETIENPMPLWKQKGFDCRQEILEMIG